MHSRCECRFLQNSWHKLPLARARWWSNEHTGFHNLKTMRQSWYTYRLLQKTWHNRLERARLCVNVYTNLVCLKWYPRIHTDVEGNIFLMQNWMGTYLIRSWNGLLVRKACFPEAGPSSLYHHGDRAFLSRHGDSVGRFKVKAHPQYTYP